MDTIHEHGRQIRRAGVGLLLLAAPLGAQTPTNDFIAEVRLNRLPQDVAITPNGQIAVVRSQGPSSALQVPGQLSGDEITVWRTDSGTRIPLAQCNGIAPGRGGITVGYSSDAIAIHDDVAVVIGSSATANGVQTRTDVSIIRFGGPTPWCVETYQLTRLTPVPGDVTVLGQDAGLASDVEITPDGRMAVVNHRNWVHFFDLTGTEPEPWTMVNIGDPSSDGPCYPGPQSDSVVVTNDTAVVMTTRDQAPGFPRPWAYVLDLTAVFTPAGTLIKSVLPLGYEEAPVTPHDLAVTPDGTLAVATFSNGFRVIDMSSGAELFGQNLIEINRQRQFGSPALPVDSVELTNERAVLLAAKNAGTSSETWAADVWDLTTFTQVASFEGTEDGALPHDFALEQLSTGETYAVVKAGRQAAGATGSDAVDVLIRGIESPAPTAQVEPSDFSPFALAGDVFCSDSTGIVVDETVSPALVFGVTTGANFASKAWALVASFDLSQVGATAIGVTTSYPGFDTVPADVAIDERDILVRMYAPPTDPGAPNGRDIKRDVVQGGANPVDISVDPLGASGDAGILKFWSVDSVVSAGDYTVSIAGAVVGNFTAGYVHFVKSYYQ